MSANLVPVRSGQHFEALFQTGGAPAGDRMAIEREGPFLASLGARPTIYRQSLPETLPAGLNWYVDRESGEIQPEIALERIDENDVLIESWEVKTDLLALDATDEVAIFEHGNWGAVFEYFEDNQHKFHHDYIDSRGATIRFGTGEFGLIPAEGSRFRVIYRTAHSANANLAPLSLRLASDHGPFADAPLKMPASILSLENPLALTNAHVSRPLALDKMLAPSAANAIKKRAVREADFIECLLYNDELQSAIADTRWTGAWLTSFCAVDPHHHFGLSEELRETIELRLDDIRMAGRPAILQDTSLRALDLKISICVAPSFAFGDVAQAIIETLAGDPIDSYFGTDRLSFGSVIYRADLEATIAAVAGVKQLRAIEYRWRGEAAFQPFIEDQLRSESDQIPCLRNDPVRPDLGAIRVFEREIVDEVLS